MNFLICADIFETLGLGWEKILLYLANFAVLFVGLTFLLYKPIKKFMAKRTQEIAEEVAAGDKIKAEAEEIRKQGEETARLAEEEAKKKIFETEQEKENALAEKENIISSAKAEAEKIVSDAKKSAKEEKRRVVLDAKNDVAGLALDIAKEILSREIVEKDNEKLIDDCIKEWKSND